MNSFKLIRYGGTKTSRRFCANKTDHFVTIPMFYVNSDPHIGHLYSAVLADAIHRWKLMCDESDMSSSVENRSSSPRKYRFVVGTDEHGKKIESAAKTAGHSPLEHCDFYSSRFRDLFQRFNISHTFFSRTTDPRHKRAVEHFWSQLERGGFIRKNVYEGWYSSIDECFYPNSEVEDLVVVDSGRNERRKVAKETQSPVELAQEENYMFPLGQFRDKIRHWINAISPEQFRSLAEHYIPNSDQANLSISRPISRSAWGIQVPNDPSQTIYVWLDALISYLSAVGYPDAFVGDQQVTLHWPPDIQVIGKDILRFHAIYWPAFLMAVDLPLPKRLLVHSHWLVDRVKMSKSRGNVVCPFEASQRLSVDGLRYFLLKCGVPHEDGNFTLQKAIEVINSDLVNDLGNLVQRSVNSKLNPQQIYPVWNPELIDMDKLGMGAQNLINRLRDLKEEVGHHFAQFNFHRGIESIAETVRAANALFHSSAPWKKQLGPEVASTLYLVYETSRICSILLRPVAPEYADRVLTRLGLSQPERLLRYAEFNLQARNDEISLGQDNGPIWPRIL